MGAWRRGWLRALLFLALLAAYLFLYLFPAAKQINRCRRQAADLTRQQLRQQRLAGAFVPFTAAEERLLAAMEARARGSLPATAAAGLAAELERFLGDLAGRGGLSGWQLAAAASEPTAGADWSAAGPALTLLRYRARFQAPAAGVAPLISGLADFGRRLRLERITYSDRGAGGEWVLDLLAFAAPAGYAGPLPGRFNLDAESRILWRPIGDPPPAAPPAAADSGCPLAAFAGPAAGRR